MHQNSWVGKLLLGFDVNAIYIPHGIQMNAGRGSSRLRRADDFAWRHRIENRKEHVYSFVVAVSEHPSAPRILTSVKKGDPIF